MHSRGIELAPFYDLAATESCRPEHGNDPRWPAVELSIQSGQAKTFAEVTRDNFRTFAAQLGVNLRAASRLLEEFTAKIAPTADASFQELEALDVAAPALRAGPLRVLNTIRYVVIREMVGRLS